MKTGILVFIFILLTITIQAQINYYLFDLDGNLAMPDDIPYFNKIEIENDNSGFYYAYVCKDKKWGILDILGQVQIPLEYQKIAFWYPYRTSAVMKEGKWGFINSKGELVIPYKYLGLARSRMNRDRCSVKNELGLWGVLDITTGEEVFPCKYEKINNFEGDYAIFTKNEKLGIVYKGGKEVFPATYKILPDYRSKIELKYHPYTKTSIFLTENQNEYPQYRAFLLDSLSNILLSDVDYIDDFLGKRDITCAGKYGKKAIINAQGEYIRSFIYDDVVKGGDGLIGIIYDAKHDREERSDWFDEVGKLILTNNGSIAEMGDTVFVFREEQIDSYSYTGKKLGERKCQVQEKGLYIDYDEKSSLYGFIDQEGRLVIPHQYLDVEPFNNGRAQVTKNGRKGGVIDTLNRVIVPFKYNGSELYPETKRIFLRKGNKRIIVDWDGNFVSPYTYDDMKSTWYESYLVCRNSKWGIINTEGKEIVPCIYDDISLELPDKATIWEDNKVGLLDITTNKILLPCKYDKIEVSVKSKYIDFLYKGKWGISDLDGNEIIQPLYDDKIRVLQNNRFVARIGENEGLLNLNGDVIIPFENIDIKKWGDLLIITSYQQFVK
ncbi:WG repeat-containing protein [Dysgonomonas sp. 521]|uniref:WG repeat-containing protein n=1 Tax=Dysgonomonas sp. 521 TaxID=2302932 RepID=UPI0013D27914|nr:WG repeat-containing protein [Dysgonomonas sp. 521]NDV94372.1 WG repeat-containing protein [Dysgonomonas sp. 521]